MKPVEQETIDKMGNFHNAMVALIDQADIAPPEALMVLSMLHDRLVKIMELSKEAE